MLEYLYTHDYSDISEHDSIDLSSYVGKASVTSASETEDGFHQRNLARTEDDKLNICWLDSTMYILGERYRISGLKKCSLEKFRRLCKADPRKAISSDVVHQVYNGTLETDRSLRDLLIETICTNSSLRDMEHNYFEALESSHSFATDIALSLLKARSQTHAT
jgi:hypothetical protein